MAKKNDIANAESASLQPMENIENLIRIIRGKQAININIQIMRVQSRYLCST